MFSRQDSEDLEHLVELRFQARKGPFRASALGLGLCLQCRFCILSYRHVLSLVGDPWTVTHYSVFQPHQIIRRDSGTWRQGKQFDNTKDITKVLTVMSNCIVCIANLVSQRPYVVHSTMVQANGISTVECIESLVPIILKRWISYACGSLHDALRKTISSVAGELCAIKPSVSCWCHGSLGNGIH